MIDLKVAVSFTRGQRIWLSERQQPFGCLIGDYRYGINRARGYRPRVIQDHFAILGNDRGGGLVETAVAVAANVCPMIQFDSYYHYNLRLPSGDLLNVVWDHPHGVIKLDCAREAARVKAKKEAPDLYLVLTGDGVPTTRGWLVFTVAGWTTHAEVLASPIEDLGHGPCYQCVTLHPTLEILAPVRGQGYREGPVPGCFDFESPDVAGA